MIRKLHIESYGKFRGRSFDFGPVTLFFGRNEAGKTTLFDAVFDKLCAPKASTDPGKVLKNRYGTDRRASLEFDGEETRIPAADFLNLFAIRSGDVNFKSESNSEWMNHVKSGLFSGGVDPGSIARKLERELATKEKGSLNAEAIALQAELAELRAELDAASAARTAYLEDEKRVETMDLRRRSADEDAGGIAREVDALEKSVSQQNLLREEKTLREILSRPAGRRKFAAELARYARYTREGLDGLRRVDERIKGLAAEAGKARAGREAAEAVFRRLLDEKNRAESERNLFERVRALAEVLKGGLSDRDRLIDRKSVVVLRIPLIAGAVLLLGAGGAAFFFLPEEFRLAGLVAGAALSLVPALFSVRREVREDSRRFDEALRSAAERWQRETGESWSGLGYEAVLVALGRAAERAGAAAERYERCRTESSAGESRIAAFEAAYKRAAADHEEAAREMRGILEAAGAAGLAEYAEGLGRRKILEDRLAEVDASLRDAWAKFGAASDEELESLVSRRISELRERITEEEISDSELRLKENLLRDKRRRLESLRGEERAALEDFSLNLGGVRERFKGLPERIAGLERKIALREKRLAETRIEQKALEIAKDIYFSLTDDAEGMLKGLSEDIGAAFSRFIAEKREIGLDSFSVESADIADAEGSARRKENLSAGTRDAFLLAARLVLARKSLAAGRKALVVLDEPFIALDRQRTGNALEVLREFHESTGWQIVIFSKDEALAKQAGKVFGGLLTVTSLSDG